MSQIITTFESKIFLELTPSEAMALDAIFGYGPEEFKKWFNKHLGTYYLKPWEKSLDSLFDKARKLHYAVEQLKEAKEKIKTITV